MLRDKENIVREFRVLGNWVDIKKGTAEGSNHKDAKRFVYELPPVIKQSGDYEISIRVVDEFGNNSEPIRGMVYFK